MGDEEFQAVLRYVTETLQRNEGRGLKRTECCVLLAAWQNLRYDDVPGVCPEECSYSPGTLQRDAAPKLWKRLRVAWNQKQLKKSTFRSTVEALMADETQPFSNPTPEANTQPTFSSSAPLANPITESSVPSSRSNSIEAIEDLHCDNAAFYGRTRELAEWETLLTGERYRLIVLSGPMGAGKTWLLGQLLRGSLAHRHVFYRHASRVPTIADLYQSFMAFLQVPIDSTLLSDEPVIVDQLIQQLGQRPYLIVLDQAEELNVPLDVLGSERLRESRGYQLFLEALTKRYHRSCVVWVSRIRPNLLVTDYRYFKEEKLLGFSKPEGLAWLAQELQSVGTPKAQKTLFTLCAGLPQLLQGAVHEIRRFHNGDGRISDFLSESVESCQSWSQRLLPKLQDLSEPELSVLYWLALSSQSSSKLQEHLTAAEPDTPAINRVLRSLSCRYLTMEDQSSTLIHLTPPILKPFILTKFAKIMAKEVLNHNPRLLHQHPILLATAAEQIRQNHDRLIMRIIMQVLRRQVGRDPIRVKQALTPLLNELHHRAQPQSYAAGNLINLAIALNLDLHGWDLTNLYISQADLRQRSIRNVNLARTRLKHNVFMPGLRGDVFGAINADGSLLAIGDVTGGVWVWRYVSQQRLALINYLSVHNPVRALIFCPASDALAIADDQGQVQFYWDILQWPASLPLSLTLDAPSPITCLDVSADGHYLAVGRQDGSIVIWDCTRWLCHQVLNAHDEAVCHLTFSQADVDIHHLISCGDENSACVWVIGSDNALDKTVPAIPYYAIRATFNTSREQILWAKYHDQQIHIGSLERAATDYHQLSHPGGYVVTVAFSPKGQYFASSAQDKTIRIWDLNRLGNVPLQTLSGFEQPVSSLAFSLDGRFLLTRTRFGIILWETSSGKCLRRFTSVSITDPEADQPFYDGLMLEQAQGLSEVEKRVLAMQGAII